MTYKTNTQQALFAPFVDKRTLAQVELENHTTERAQTVAPEEITTVEISFYDYELYTGDKLIACITYDCNDFVTQPWLVMVNGAEIMNKNEYLVEELDPLMFCQIWGLTYEKASEYLKVTARTMAAYACQGKSTKRNPSSRVKALAAIQHNTWIKEGKQPIDMPLLKAVV